MFDYQRIIDKYYPAENAPLRDIYIRHCRSVAEKAIDIAHRLNINIPDEEIEAAAMMHDIGIVLTDAEGIHCYGKQHYLTHGRIGADLLRNEGAPEHIARVAERHTGTGLTPDDLKNFNGLLPDDRSYMPQTQLERLICYADKFYSKNGDMKEKSIERVRNSLTKFGEGAKSRFEALHNEFSTDSNQ